jgi:HSP20 family protein
MPYIEEQIATSKEALMDLVRFDPFSMFREFDRLVDRSPASQVWAPRIDVLDRQDEIMVRVDIAGVDPAGIDITLEDRTLTISGTRTLDESVDENGYHRREIFAGEFRRTLILPEGLDADEITASADRGLLEVTLPRRAEVLPRKVKIDVAG